MNHDSAWYNSDMFCNGKINSHFVPGDIMHSDVLYSAKTIHTQSVYSSSTHIQKEYDFPLEYVKCGVGLILVKKKMKKDKEIKATATLHKAPSS